MKSGSYPFTYFGPFALDGEWTNPREQDRLAYTNDTQISEKSGSIRGIDERSGVTYPKTLLPPSTLSGYEGIKPALIEDFVEDAANSQVEVMNRAMSFELDGQSTSTREAPERPYFCDICYKHYSQPQGVSRHRREAHNSPHSCLRCDFKWNRPYQYRIHLVKWHPDVDPNNVLGKPAGSRCRPAILGRDLQLHARATEPDGWSKAKSQQRSMRPRPAVAKVTRVPSPAMSHAVYDLQPEYAETEITTRKHEGVNGLEFINATDAPSSVSLTEERA